MLAYLIRELPFHVVEAVWTEAGIVAEAGQIYW
jgi:hypothetical protein